MKIRKLLENWVVAINPPLVEAVKSMDIITLLRNAAPPYRADFAIKLYTEGTITKEQATEFTNRI